MTPTGPILTFEQALDAWDAALDTYGPATAWAKLTPGLPRNDLPALLAEVEWCFDQDALARPTNRGVGDV